MIKEISNFVESIAANDPDYFTSNLNPSPGLHITLEIDENEDVIEDSYKSFIFKKDGSSVTLNKEGNEVPIDCNVDIAKLEYYSSLISIDKPIDSNKKIHSSVPYSIWFKKEKFTNAKERIEEFYERANKYVPESDKEIVSKIRDFASGKLFKKIGEDINYDHIKKTEYVKIYFNVSFEKIKSVQDSYLQKKIFVKDDFNVSIENQEVFGLSGFLNGANVKKKFMQHQTSNFLVNNRITRLQAINLFKFEKLLKSKPRKFPNPLPIFIEKEELNNDVIRLFGREGVKNFHDIIKQMFKKRQDDLTNYYLMNWNNTKNGIVINDIDFVSAFEYKIENMTLKNVMKLSEVQDIPIKNIFNFEVEIIQKIFSNTLIVQTKKGDILFKYFDEINSNYCSKATYQNTLNYRKNVYDFIYKSKREAVTGLIFYKIVMSEILDQIKRNEDFNKDWNIKEKLNILFSINDFFDKTNKTFGGIDMPTQIPKYLTELREIINSEDKHLPDDDNFFAFAAGQLIYYIIYQSQTANKTHALLEPYISKTDPNQFRMMITRGIEQFKHSLNFGYNKMEKLASEVLGYESKTELKKLQPILLAGYFSNSLLLEKKQS